MLNKNFARGLVEGLAKSTTKGVQDAMDDLDGRLSRLSEKRMARTTTEQARYRQDFRGNEEEIKSLVSALGPDGEGILHSLIVNNGYQRAKQIVPAVVTKMSNTNLPASAILKYKRADGSEPVSVKQLTELVTVPMNIPDLDYGKALEGSGSHILNILTNSEDGVQKYAKKYVETDMALSGLSDKPVSYGDTGAAGKTEVDMFELALTNNLKDNLVKLNAAAENETDPKKKKEYQARALQVEGSIIANQDKRLTESQLRSQVGLYSKSAAGFAQVEGDINKFTGDWISLKERSKNSQLVSLQGQEMGEALQWSKINKFDYGKGFRETAKGLVPSKLPTGFTGLDGKEGSYITPNRLMHAAAVNGFSIRIVPKTDDAPGYITIGERITYDKIPVPPPDKTGFQSKLTPEAVTKINNDATINSAITKIKNSANPRQQKIHAVSIKNRLAILAPTADYKVEFKKITGLDWKPEYDK